ncbi:MAG TPA: TadE/TadG family type IV pilus assembly protein [Pseudolabrys sp.]|nr:TadE/TadG family type IV pilus assembly protein [Pseudolabrys sp.]
MLERIRSLTTMPLRRLLPARAARRFARQQEGAAAVEFALVAVPFLALTFAIIETALVFFAGQTLESAASEAGRLVMTGQAQNGGFSQADFKNAVCADLAGGLFDCANGVYVNVTSYASFSAVNTAPPVTNGVLNTANMAYTPGGPNCIVAVQLFYQWPIYVSLLGNNLSNLNGNYRLLVATSVFRNEPYGPAAC